MINYAMIYGVGETSRILEVNRDLIKKWAYIFSAYVSKGANPGKELARTFTIDDIRVFAHVSKYWEDEPDLEYIKSGLSSGDHLKDTLIKNLLTKITPLFQNMPEDIDETWRGTVFGGEFCFGDFFELADSYKLAGDKLVEIAFKDYDERELFQPAIYNYRHATELYLKAIVGQGKIHDLALLFEKLRVILKEEFGTEPPGWFRNFILAFHDFDPGSTTFRYGDELPTIELYCDIRHVKKIMSWCSEVFRRIRIEREKGKFSS